MKLSDFARSRLVNRNAELQEKIIALEKDNEKLSAKLNDEVCIFKVKLMNTSCSSVENIFNPVFFMFDRVVVFSRLKIHEVCIFTSPIYYISV